jgi:hypothetical protein
MRKRSWPSSRLWPRIELLRVVCPLPPMDTKANGQTSPSTHSWRQPALGQKTQGLEAVLDQNRRILGGSLHPSCGPVVGTSNRFNKSAQHGRPSASAGLNR